MLEDDLAVRGFQQSIIALNWIRNWTGGDGKPYPEAQ